MSDISRTDVTAAAPIGYRTILVHVDGAACATARIALAVELAQRHEAHLIGAAFTGLSRFVYRDASVDLARTVLAPYMDGIYRKTESELDRFAQAAAVLPSREARLVDDEAGAGLVLAARYADLVVLGQREPGTPAAAAGDLVAQVLLACPRPLLIVPYAGPPRANARRVLAGWNGSAEAARALAAALPLLRHADSVTIAMAGPAEGGGPGADACLAAWLLRHGIAAAMVHASAHLDAGDVLLSMAADLGADLLVMGGYGHTRLRELVLGGVTRSVLEAMTVPVLMAH